jgi:hypothetical protein
MEKSSMKQWIKYVLFFIAGLGLAFGIGLYRLITQKNMVPFKSCSFGELKLTPYFNREVGRQDLLILKDNVPLVTLTENSNGELIASVSQNKKGDILYVQMQDPDSKLWHGTYGGSVSPDGYEKKFFRGEVYWDLSLDGKLDIRYKYDSNGKCTNCFIYHSSDWLEVDHIAQNSDRVKSYSARLNKRTFLFNPNSGWMEINAALQR